MTDPVQIERLADRAWPAAESVPLGPWVLRANAGVTRRTNSVFTAGRDDLHPAELDRWVAAAERFYAERGLPSVFQVSAATGAQRGLDTLLEARGYRAEGRSEVWVAEAVPSAQPPRTDGTFVRADDPSPEWFNVAFADDVPVRRRVHEAIASRSPRPRVFTSVVLGGRVAACAMAVAGGSSTGLFCMTTHPDFRRHGLGRALVADVRAWAAAQGDATTYLQVMCENEPAKALYRDAGFRPAYGYHYRVK